MSKPATPAPDLDAFAAQVHTQHAELTAAFEQSQVTAEAAWADHEAASTALTEFRTKYGPVLRALTPKE